MGKPLLRSLAFTMIALPILSGCVSKENNALENPNLEVLPNLSIAGASLREGGTVKYGDLTISVKDIDTESYPSTVTLFDGKQDTVIPIGNWEIINDILIRTEFQGRTAQSADGFILLNFHDLKKLMNKPTPDPPGKLMEGQSISEREIKFMKDGFVSLNSILENDQIRRDDEVAEVQIYYKGKSYEAVVRENSHTMLSPQLILGAGEIFAGDLPGRGTTTLSVSTPDVAWKDAIDYQKVVIDQTEPVGFDTFHVSLYPLPSAPSADLEGQAVAPTDYRALLTIRTLDDKASDFILTNGQSLRLGRKELMLNSVNESSAEFDVYSYRDEVYASNRRNAGDPIEVAKTNTYQDDQPTNTALTMQVGDALDFWDARFEVVRIIENDTTNLFDDEAIFSIVGRGVSENLTVREGSRYTVRGENRWWVIKANSIEKNGRVGEIAMELETGQFLGGGQRN